MANVDFLLTVRPENYFKMTNGRVFGNLRDLYTAVLESPGDIFYNHVTADRNDFANWIKYCVHDDVLFNELSGVKDMVTFLDVLKKRIDLLQNPTLQNMPLANVPTPPVNNSSPVSKVSAAISVVPLTSVNTSPISTTIVSENAQVNASIPAAQSSPIAPSIPAISTVSNISAPVAANPIIHPAINPTLNNTISNENSAVNSTPIANPSMDASAKSIDVSANVVSIQSSDVEIMEFEQILHPLVLELETELLKFD